MLWYRATILAKLIAAIPAANPLNHPPESVGGGGLGGWVGGDGLLWPLNLVGGGSSETLNVYGSHSIAFVRCVRCVGCARSNECVHFARSIQFTRSSDYILRQYSTSDS
jgi:hypothetical protein